MDELNNIKIEHNAIIHYKILPKVNSTICKIVASLSLCYILYNNYLVQSNYVYLYHILYRQIATIFKWHNRHERTYNRKHNLIFADIDDFMFFMFYIRANDSSTSTKLFKQNLINIFNIFDIYNNY